MVVGVRLQLPVSSSITFGRESQQRHHCDLLSGGTSLQLCLPDVHVSDNKSLRHIYTTSDISVWASESKVRHNQYKWIDVSCLHWSEPVSDIFVSDIPCPSSSLHVAISLDLDFRVRPQLCNAHAQSRLFKWSCTVRCCCQNSLPTMINLLN